LYTILAWRLGVAVFCMRSDACPRPSTLPVNMAFRDVSPMADCSMRSPSRKHFMTPLTGFAVSCRVRHAVGP
jgi:hypothetical protein